ncbi:hypothetical protein THICB2_310069 [Thiomonas sp. CB2]|nr:hypothetical protein THICB2_310069 [Thiomonas sp. CB2]
MPVRRVVALHKLAQIFLNDYQCLPDSEKETALDIKIKRCQ